MRQFYRTYSVNEPPSRRFNFSWSPYLILMRIDNPNSRSFCELESAANHWSLRELQRQIDSVLYERLTLSRDKEPIRQALLQQKLREWTAEFDAA